MKDRRIFGIIGNPVIHSLSPPLLRGGFEANTLPYSYVRIASDSLEEALSVARAIGVNGLNVTAPYKEKILEYVTNQSLEVQKLKAVNTVTFEEAALYAYNTDVFGILDCLKEPLMHLIKPKIVVLGTGGAARAAIYATTQGNFETTLIGRSEKAGQTISHEMKVPFLSLTDERVKALFQSADVLISCVSTADPVLPEEFLHSKLIILDALYSKESALITAAKKKGCSIIDGKEWLIRQGAKAYELFTGLPSPLRAMRLGLQQAEKHAKLQNIALIGFMGSGKSEVAAQLSELLGYNYIDLDKVIETQAQRPISEIFEEDGEEYFRELETHELHGLSLQQPCVLATGGGLVLSEGNRKYLREKFFPIWLWVSPNELHRRLGNDTSRPLLGKGDRGNRVQELLSERIPFYAETSELVMNGEIGNPSKIAGRIYSEMKVISLA